MERFPQDPVVSRPCLATMKIVSVLIGEVAETDLVVNFVGPSKFILAISCAVWPSSNLGVFCRSGE